MFCSVVLQNTYFTYQNISMNHSTRFPIVYLQYTPYRTCMIVSGAAGVRAVRAATALARASAA